MVIYVRDSYGLKPSCLFKTSDDCKEFSVILTLREIGSDSHINLVTLRPCNNHKPYIRRFILSNTVTLNPCNKVLQVDENEKV